MHKVSNFPGGAAMSKALSVIIRPDYLTLCEGNHCAAAILDLFRRWTFYKKNKGGEAGAWIYKSQPNMAADMFGLFGENKVAAALNYLCDKGFLKWRHNPHSRQNKTRQYRFEDAAVKAALKLQNETLKAQNQGLETSEQGDEALELSSQGHKNAASDSKNQSDSSSKSLSDQSSSHPPPNDDWKPFLQFEQIFHCSPETDIRTALIREYKRLGEAQAVVVLERCRPSARTWKYLLTSLTNEHSNEGSDGAKWRDDPYGVNVPTPAPEASPTISPDEIQAEIATIEAELAKLTAPPTPSTRPIQERPTPRVAKGISPEAAWHIAYSQLEIQMDRGSFDTFIRGTKFLKFEGGVFNIGARNTYARDMLQHRLYRDIRRIVSDVLGEKTELFFEVVKDAEPELDEELPLYKLLAKRAELESRRAALKAMEAKL